MMQNYLDFSTLMALIIVETDNKIIEWTKSLSTKPNFEFGDDPEIIKAIENDLEKLNQRIKLVKPQFSLNKVPLHRANAYFEATKQLKETLRFVRSVREKEFGSQQNTRLCISYLESCSEKVRLISQHIETPPPIFI